MLMNPTPLTTVDLKLAVVPDPLTAPPTARLVDVIRVMSGLRSRCHMDRPEAQETGDRYFQPGLTQLYADVRSSCVVVVNQGQVVGILTERDIVRLSAQQEISDTLTVGEIMVAPVVTLATQELTDLFSTVRLLREYQFRHLPIVDSRQRLVGLLTHESLRHLSRPLELLRLRGAKEVMTQDVVCAPQTASMLAIAQTLASHRVSSVVLVQEEADDRSADAPPLKKPVGIVTEQDLVRFQTLELPWETCQAWDVMSQPVFSVGPDESLWAVQEAMDQRLIRRLLVVGDRGELLGIITQSSLLRALDPLEMYKLASTLKEQVDQLEAEKRELLVGRADDLEREVQTRTLSLQMAAERDRLLADLATQIRSSLSLKEILDTTVEQVRRVLGCERVSIWEFVDDNRAGVVVAEATTSKTSLLGERVDDNCFAETIVKQESQGRTRVVSDIYATPMSDCHREVLIRLQTRSKILVPLFCGDSLWGMLHVSESSFPRLWQTGDVELVTSLGIQLAIAIQQATTYGQLQAELQERQQAEAALQSLVAGTAATTGKDFFPALVTHIAAALNVAYAVVTTLGNNHRLDTVAVWGNGKLQAPFSYTVPNTPCEQTLANGRFFCDQQLANQFPMGPEGDLDLAALGAESYLGVALRDSNGEAIGNLCVLDKHPIRKPEQAEQILAVFAARASAELDRQRATTQLTQLNQELEAKVAERTAALQEREQFLKTVLDTFPLSVFWKDQNGIMRGCNQEFVQTLGIRSREEIIGKGCLDSVMVSAEAAASQQDDCRVMASGRAELGIETKLTRTDGEIRWLETNRLPLRDHAGEVVGLVGTFQDITVRKEVELKLRAQAEQERLLSSITQRMRSSLNLTDILNATVAELRQVLQSDRVLVCRIFEDRTGAAITESASLTYPLSLERGFPKAVFPLDLYKRYVMGRVLVLNDVERETDRMLPDLRAFLRTINVRAMLVVPIIQGQTLWGLLVSQQCEEPRQWKLREIRLLQQTATHIAIAIQQVRLFEQLQEELGERQQAQQLLTERNQQLAVSNEQLARATRLKDEFLANMSHELRTPLNAILGMAEGLQETVFGPVTPPQIKALQTIEKSGTHLLELINDILDVAKIEAGQIELQCVPTPLQPLCQSSLIFIRQQADKKRIQVRLQLPPGLPDVMVDERRIRQVLLNLLNNAVKFTPEGGSITLAATLHDRPTLAVPTLPQDLPPPLAIAAPPSPEPLLPIAPAYIHLSISDTGIGIAPENISRLFQPFIQIDSALDRQYNGTGLGLALVKRIIDLHGGQVAVTSRVGDGSCFRLSLPCATPPLGGQVTGESTDGIVSAVTFPVSEKLSPVILLAEDNEANISTMSSYLRAKGYEVRIAQDGRAAMAEVLTEPPDLILMDIQMPDMDGLTAIQELRRHSHLKSLPIVALTALAMKGDRDRCLGAGATDYLSKPVKLKQLVTLIQHLLLPPSH